MDIQKFVSNNRIELARLIEEYLASNLGHDEIQRHIDKVFSNWENMNYPKSLPMLDGEKEFWCTFWAVQHLATEDHWADGVTQKELEQLLSVLNGVEELPPGYEGRRP